MFQQVLVGRFAISLTPWFSSKTRRGKGTARDFLNLSHTFFYVIYKFQLSTSLVIKKKMYYAVLSLFPIVVWLLFVIAAVPQRTQRASNEYGFFFLKISPILKDRRLFLSTKQFIRICAARKTISSSWVLLFLNNVTTLLKYRN